MEDNNMKTKKKNMTLSNTLFLLKICFSTAPLMMICTYFECTMHEIQVFFEHTFGIKFILEVIEFNKPVWYAVLYLAILMIYIAFSQILTGILYFRIDRNFRPKIIEALRMKIFEKARKMDLSNYDNPEFYNDFVLNASEADKCIERLINITKTLLSGITSAVICGSYFLYLDPGSAVFVLLPTILSLVLGKKINKVEFSRTLEKKPVERKRDYIHRIFYLTDYAKEIRLNALIKNKFRNDFTTVNDELYKTERKYSKIRWFLNFLRQYLFSDFIGDTLFIIYLVYQAAVLHKISYSSVVVMFNSSGILKNGLREIALQVTSASENSLYIGKIRTFLETKINVFTKNEVMVPSKPTTIELKNVSFKYDTKEILHNISFKISPYEKIALVGYNGAGKTTLVKLLMRLYDPTEGEILLDGKSLKDYDTESLHSKTGVVFQDFKLFAATLRENIIMNDIPQTSEIDQKCTESLKEAGFEKGLKKLPQKLDTPVTHEFEEDGTDFSGGESQKIAIARVLYKDANLVILDEPSSALDPIAEYNLNLTIHEAAKKRSVIFISHRLSTTRDADRIIMLEKGCITESGTHAELLSKQGTYSKMWNVQAGRYLN